MDLDREKGMGWLRPVVFILDPLNFLFLFLEALIRQ